MTALRLDGAIKPTMKRGVIAVTMLSRAVFAALLTGPISVGAPSVAQAPVQDATSPPADAQARELQQQVETLQKQLDKLKASPDAAVRLMQQMMGPGMVGGAASTEQEMNPIVAYMQKHARQ
jgi:uncharacterized protein YlxW (UPF0749 family)